MDKQEKNKETLQNLENTMDIDEQELIELECPTDSEESLEITMEHDLKL
jgi:hypothetical protein